MNNSNQPVIKTKDITGNFDERLLEEAVEVAKQMNDEDVSIAPLAVGKARIYVARNRARINAVMLIVTIDNKDFFVGI